MYTMVGTHEYRLPRKVTIEDVTLRDGLQSEARLFSVEEKQTIAEGLVAAGVKRVQIGSFVNPKKVPQMANTGELFRRLPRGNNIIYTALVLNESGLEQAADLGIRHLYMAISATESHNLENNHCTLREARRQIERMITWAKGHDIIVRAGIMMAFGCSFEGKVPTERVLDLAKQYQQLGADVIDLADTSGMANPRQVFELVSLVYSETGQTPLSLHLHDARGLGLANMLSGLAAGVMLFDTSLGGLGGCPFIPNAAGNIATEDTAFMMNEMGIETGIDIPALFPLTHTLEELLQRRLPGKISHLPSPT